MKKILGFLKYKNITTGFLYFYIHFVTEVACFYFLSNLVGDSVYGPAKCPFKLQGQTLHAKIIGIVHPRSQEYLEADAPLPEYFVSLLNKLENMN